MSRSKLDRLTDAQLRDVALKLIRRDPTAGWAPVMQELLLRMATAREEETTTVDVGTLHEQLIRLRTINGEALQLAARLQELTDQKKGNKHG